MGTFSGGIMELDEGVAGVGAGLPGPPGPKGISILGGTVDVGVKLGSELKIPSFFSANVLRCEDNQLVL